jgi:microcystin degradation protein MlrC
MAIACQGKPAVITDSGDNTTSGATGWNTFVLRQVLSADMQGKKTLFASICDPETYKTLSKFEVGQTTAIRLGTGKDVLSEPVELNVQVLSKGDVLRPRTIGSGKFDPTGHEVTVRVLDKNIDIIVTDHRQSYCCDEQMEAAGVVWTDYDVVVVKQGYIFPDLKAKAALAVMSLTDGATPQDTASIPFKRIMRPMFPVDDI